jgi:integrase
MGAPSQTKTRGVYERDRGSGIWWIRWADGLGRIRRQKVGPRPLAIAAYHKRKAEAREAGLFPELYRRGIRFAELCEDFKRAKPNHWSYQTGNAILERLRKWFDQMAASMISPQIIEERLNSLIADGRTPATANRYRSVASAIFNWGIRNQKVTANPVRAVKLRREDNHRLRFLEKDEEVRLRASIRPPARWCLPSWAPWRSWSAASFANACAPGYAMLARRVSGSAGQRKSWTSPG